MRFVDVIIPTEKLTHYLLVFQPENDKSKFLAQAGYTSTNPEALEQAIRQLIRENDAIFDRQDRFGEYYKVEGLLPAIHGQSLPIVTVWIMRTTELDVYRFVTLKPQKRIP